MCVSRPDIPRLEAHPGESECQWFSENRRSSSVSRADKDAKVTLYREWSAQGNSHGQYLLGSCVYYGDWAKKDWKEAFNLFKFAAGQSNPWGMYGLGNCYSHGKGVSKDEQQAIEWYRKAAELGHVKSQDKLAKQRLVQSLLELLQI